MIFGFRKKKQKIPGSLPIGSDIFTVDYHTLNNMETHGVAGNEVIWYSLSIQGFQVVGVGNGLQSDGGEPLNATPKRLAFIL